MEFFIKKGSESPVLLMEVVNDGRTDNYKDFNKKLVNSFIRFSMKRESDGIQTIFMKNAYITEKILINKDAPPEYYIYYKWTTNDTKVKGRYIGEFSITNDYGHLICPIREPLYINII
jgi:hypothetical protein